MDRMTNLKGHFVLLRAGALRLLLPQASVGPAEYRDPGDLSRRVVAPSERLQALDEVPAGRFVLAQLAGDGGVGEGAPWLAWDEVRVLIDADLRAHALPPALRSPGMPVTAYVEFEDGIALYGDARAVSARLGCEVAT
jgi:hypothetical protein